MTGLNPHPECSYELCKDFILEKSDGKKDAKVDHNQESYASFYEETSFQKITSGAELFLQNRYVVFKETPLKEIAKVFDNKE